MATPFEDAENLALLQAAAQILLFGAENEDVTFKGLTQPTWAKQVKERFAALAAQAEGFVPYETKAQADAAGQPPLHEGQPKLVIVWNDSVELNGIYGWDGTELMPSQYDPKRDTAALQSDLVAQKQIAEDRLLALRLPYGYGFRSISVDNQGNISSGEKDSGEPVGILRNMVDANQLEAQASVTLKMPYVEGDYVEAAIDGAGNLSFGRKATGEITGYLADSIAQEASARQQSIAELQASVDGLPAHPVRFVHRMPYVEGDYVEASIDAAGNLIFGRMATGEVSGYLRDELMRVESLLNAEVQRIDQEIVDLPDFSVFADAADIVAEDRAAPIVYSKSDSGFDRVFLLDGNGETAITPAEFNATMPQAFGSFFQYAADIDGQLRAWRQAYDGFSRLRSVSDTVEMIFIIGQSNTIPRPIAGGGAALTVGAVDNGINLMFNGNADYAHPWPNYQSGWVADDHDAEVVDAQVDHFVNLECVNESHLTGFTELVNDGSHIYLCSGHGRGGHNLANLSKGLTDDTNYAYRNSIKCIQRGKQLANKLGLKFKVSKILMEHGESGSGDLQYLSLLEGLMLDYYADIAEITGQLEKPLFYLSQLSSWSIIGANGAATSHSVIAQADYAQQNSNAFLVAPRYFLPHDNGGAGDLSASDGDGIHLSAYGQRTLTEYYAKAALAGDAWSDLRPDLIVYDGAVITVTYAGRVGDLRFSIFDSVINPHGVVDPGNYGFELFDDNAVISAVAFNAAKSQVIITPSQPLSAGAELAYAYTSPVTPADAGPQTGPRGCLCDSDPTPPSQILQDHRATLGMTGAAVTDSLKNWATTFKKPISFI